MTSPFNKTELSPKNENLKSKSDFVLIRSVNEDTKIVAVLCQFVMNIFSKVFVLRVPFTSRLYTVKQQSI